MRSTTILLAATAPVAVTAHGHVTGVVAGGKYYMGYTPNIKYYKPVPKLPAWSAGGYGQGGIAPDKFSAQNIVCHDDAKPGEGYAEVSAGSSIQLQWSPWPSSHHGPVIDYLARCSGECTSARIESLRFTKIAEQGLVKPGSPSSYVFATDILIKNNSTWTVKIPANLKGGDYVLRNEIIALHTAGTVGGAQNYPQCFNIRVKGSGSVGLPEGVPATSFYKPNSQGIVFNIAANLQNYPIPGPPLWKGAG